MSSQFFLSCQTVFAPSDANVRIYPVDGMQKPNIDNAEIVMMYALKLTSASSKMHEGT